MPFGDLFARPAAVSASLNLTTKVILPPDALAFTIAGNVGDRYRLELVEGLKPERVVPAR